MQKFVCIHGHFYQPPRENPWTGEVEREASARPFHDWNERVTAECYAPNAASPLVDGNGVFTELVNNYSRISFDFGPTLLHWLESNSSELYGSIIEADRLSAQSFDGHGSAMAQVYNHMIMPLATPEDKRTQALWGAEDFERRFGHPPEGMWLPETAVDLDTLEALADARIKFTVLSPNQVTAIRRRGEKVWEDVSGGHIDTRRAYYCALPSGRTISIFFFDRGLSTGIAFGDMLEDGASFSRALMRSFSQAGGPQLVNVATDGETYGHHRREGHIALTKCVSLIDGSGSASTANYGFFLSVAPPDTEVRIAEGTSWSCSHGVERWRRNCGCGSEIRAGFNQEWRTPLRSSLDWLASRLADVYAREGSRIFVDPAASRDGLQSVAFETRDGATGYLKERMKPGLSEKEGERGAKLLEMVECSALMFASCAWFWEDMTRMETVQSLRFAAKGIELAREVSGAALDPEFERILSAARPNDRRFKTGAQVYKQLARARRWP
jgi:alpha-amylase/alpha-mannosidase (GH57 family)